MGHIYKESQMDFDVLEDSFARLAYSTLRGFPLKANIYILRHIYKESKINFG